MTNFDAINRRTKENKSREFTRTTSVSVSLSRKNCDTYASHNSGYRSSFYSKLYGNKSQF